MGSRGVNKMILIGNLGQDPELRYMPNGESVANMTIATSETWKDKQTGEMREKTEWHRVVIFGKLAEIAGRFLHKGSKVYLEGQLKTRKWTDKQSVDHYVTEIVLRDFKGEMQFLDPIENRDHQQRGGFQQEHPQAQKKPGSGFEQYEKHKQRLKEFVDDDDASFFSK